MKRNFKNGGGSGGRSQSGPEPARAAKKGQVPPAKKAEQKRAPGAAGGTPRRALKASNKTNEPASAGRVQAKEPGKDPSAGLLSPRNLLLPYQRKWADDDSRFKIGLMARQTGKDFSSAEEGIRDCYKHELNKDKTTWLVGAAGERQALESLEKWKEWTEAYKLAIEDIIEERENSEALMRSTTIVFPNGSRVIGVPANPDTMRGYSANVLMTEVAFIEDLDATWRAVYPSISNPLRGGLKKIRLISTPNGIGNKFHDLWAKNFQTPKAKWSCHKVTIWDAVAAGLPVDPEELREGLDDPEGWAQEYECEFIDTASVLLSYELIATCENPTATATISPEYWNTKSQWPVFLGIDFGRKRDLTVCWGAELLNDYLLTKEVLELPKMSTPHQVEHLRPRIRKANRVCLDYTGPGIGLGDYLVQEFGEYKPEADQFGKIELCTFTTGLKQEIFPKLKMRFEQRMLGVPVSRIIREDLHSVYRVITANSVTYKAPHTADGHADRCTGLALCNRAAASKLAPFFYKPVSISRRDRQSASALRKYLEHNPRQLHV